MQDLLFVATGRDGETVVNEGQWSLVPHWAKEKGKYAMFNARSETAHTSRGFRDAFKFKRCLIPSDGFYEWTTGDDGGRDPHHIFLPDHEPYAFAGLWAHNDTLDVTSCTILTAAADPAIAHIHDRMPIILQGDVHQAWVDPATPVDDARKLLAHHRDGELISYRVSRDVNDRRSQGSQLIEPLEAA